MEPEGRGTGLAGPGVGSAESTPVPMPGSRLVTTKVAAERTGWAYSLFEVEVGAGGAEGPHVQHREDEWLYVLEGRFGFVVEGEASEAASGAHLYVPKGALHAYRNVGGGVGRLLAVHTPGGPQERFVAAAGAASPEGIALIAAEHGIEICGQDGREGEEHPG